MIQNNNDLSSAVFNASGFLADILACYASVEVDHRDCLFGDSSRLKNAIIEVYLAILNYAMAAMNASSANAATKCCLQPFKLKHRLTKKIEGELNSIILSTDQPLSQLKSVIDSKESIVVK